MNCILSLLHACLRSKVSGGTAYFIVKCPGDNLLRSKLPPGEVNSKHTVLSPGGQSTSRGDTLLRSKVSGTDSLFRSKVSVVQQLTKVARQSLGGG